jgi:hypothetical protein
MYEDKTFIEKTLNDTLTINISYMERFFTFFNAEIECVKLLWVTVNAGL